MITNEAILSQKGNRRTRTSTSTRRSAAGGGGGLWGEREKGERLLHYVLMVVNHLLCHLPFLVGVIEHHLGPHNNNTRHEGRGESMASSMVMA